MKLVKSAFIAAALIGATAAQAQSSADLDITGEITPSSCVISITGGSVAYPSVSVISMLGGGSDFKQPGANVSRIVNVSCGSATTFGVAMTDPNIGSKIGINDGLDLIRHGIVNTAQSNAPLGHFTITYNNGTVQVDGVPPAKYLYEPATSGTPTWANNPIGVLANYIDVNSTRTWVTDPAATAAQPVTNLSVPIEIATYINTVARDAQLSSGSVQFAGRATFTVRTL